MKVYLDEGSNVANRSNDKRLRFSFKNRLFTIVILVSAVRAAPYAVSDNATFLTLNHAIWPPMQDHDIWSDNNRHFEATAREDSDNFNNIDNENDIWKQQQFYENRNLEATQNAYENYYTSDTNNDTLASKRQKKGSLVRGEEELC